MQEPWRTAIVQADDSTIRLRGYDITELMQRASFADTVFLLHRERLPNTSRTAAARRDPDFGGRSRLGSALLRDGAPGGFRKRESLSAAIAAGILAIGNDHGGAGAACMSMIAEGMALGTRAIHFDRRSRRARLWTSARAAKQRLPGMGHRVHSVDPRTAVLFAMAREEGVAGDGVLFMEALDAAVREKIKPLPINIDGALAAILHDLGFPPEAGKLIFIIGRVAGLTAEVAEEYAREKPMRIRVPVEYDGVPPRSLDQTE